MLRASVDRLFADRLSRDLIENAERGVWPAELWSRVQELGISQLFVAAEEGGVGAGWVEACVIVSAAAAHAVPLPLAENLLALWLMREAGLSESDGEGGPIGIAMPTVAGAVDHERTEVPWGHHCQRVLQIRGAGDRARAVLLDVTGATWCPAAAVSGEPRDRLRADGTATIATAPLRGGDRLLWYGGALLRASQLAGAMERLLALSVDYASERVQFGRPIGRFQAIQHALTDLAGEAAAAGMAARSAAIAADRAAGFEQAAFEIAVAKSRASEAVERTTAIAHQVHGAIGFTHEHVLHHLTRRLWTWRMEFGSAAHWSRQIGVQALACGADGLWPYVTSRGMGEQGS